MVKHIVKIEVDAADLEYQLLSEALGHALHAACSSILHTDDYETEQEHHDAVMELAESFIESACVDLEPSIKLETRNA